MSRVNKNMNKKIKNLIFYSMVSRLSAALSSATQHAMPPQNSAESGERSLITLNSLCLLCCLRDTA